MVSQRLSAAGLVLAAACATGSGTVDDRVTTPPVPASGGATAAAPAYALVMDSTTGSDDPNAVWLVRAVSQRPRMIRPVPLVYPDSLRLHGVGGDVVVEFVVDTLGHVEHDVRVPETAAPALAEPARQTIRRAEFRPGTVKGRKVRVLMTLRLKFNPRHG